MVFIHEPLSMLSVHDAAFVLQIVNCRLESERGVLDFHCSEDFRFDELTVDIVNTFFCRIFE